MMTNPIRSRAARAAALLIAAGAVGASPAAAQQSVADVLTFLVTNQSVSTGSPDRDRASAQATSDTISRALLANLATLPVSSSSAGFAFRLNPELGTVERSSRSFGPFFVERALTAGRGAASIGLTLQHFRFTSLDGHELRDGSLVTTANRFTDEPEAYDLDRLTLGIDADVATLHGNVGVADAVELGFAVPIVALRLKGERANLYRGRTFTQASASASALGLADVVLRAKVSMFGGHAAGLAAAADVRLPTGRREDLLGTGSSSLRLVAIGSAEHRAVSMHANAGMTFGGLAREIGFGGALAVAATGRFTLTGELLARHIDGPADIGTVAAPHPTLIGVETLRLRPGGSGFAMMLLSPGFKWNVTDTWVVVGNVSVPLTTAGLTSPIIPFVGIDYALPQ
jgi:hypothetical protein